MQTKANTPAKPAPAKRANKPAKPATAPVAPAAAPLAKPAAVERFLARDAATVERAATNFGTVSDRDAAYRLFFGGVMRAHNDTATLAQIHAAGLASGNKRIYPHYTGSAKATDAGAINRAVKAGYFTVSENGNRLTATDKAKSDRFYNGKA